MNTAPFIQALSVQERAGAMKLGASLVLAANGYTEDDLAKSAGIFQDAGKTMLYPALLGGIPLGMLMHIVDRTTMPDRREEREALARIRQYQLTSKNLENELSDEQNDTVPG